MAIPVAPGFFGPCFSEMTVWSMEAQQTVGSLGSVSIGGLLPEETDKISQVDKGRWDIRAKDAGERLCISPRLGDEGLAFILQGIRKIIKLAQQGRQRLQVDRRECAVFSHLAGQGCGRYIAEQPKHAAHPAALAEHLASRLVVHDPLILDDVALHNQAAEFVWLQ